MKKYESDQMTKRFKVFTADYPPKEFKKELLAVLFEYLGYAVEGGFRPDAQFFIDALDSFLFYVLQDDEEMDQIGQSDE